jgi:hypothetical protein
MTTSEVIAVIERATNDDNFRELLFTNPEKALQGYDLTAGEKELFNDLDDEKFEELRGQWIPGG